MVENKDRETKVSYTELRAAGSITVLADYVPPHNHVTISGKALGCPIFEHRALCALVEGTGHSGEGGLSEGEGRA